MEEKQWEDGEEPWWAQWVYFFDEPKPTLHRIESVKWDWSYPASGPGVMKCGKSGVAEVPGVMSRLSCPRCPVCCAAVEIPEGKGNPINAGIKEKIK